MDREIELMIALDARRSEARQVLSSRQQQGQALRLRVDRAASLSEVEVIELRADIKLFVSDRKVDEDLAGAKPFQADVEEMLESVKSFGTGEWKAVKAITIIFIALVSLCHDVLMHVTPASHIYMCTYVHCTCTCIGVCRVSLQCRR